MSLDADPLHTGLPTNTASATTAMGLHTGLPLTTGLIVAAVIAAVAAVPGAVMLVRMRSCATPGSRGPRWIIQSGVGVAVIALVGIGVSAALEPGTLGARHAWALTGALGSGLSTLLVLAGVERLPGVVDSAATRLRRRLDVLLMVPALFLSGWILSMALGNHFRQVHPHPNWIYLSGGPSVVAATLATAFGIAMVARSSASRGAVALLMSGVVALSVGGALVVVAVLADAGGVALAGGVCAGIGLITLAGCTLLPQALLEPPASDEPTRWWLSAATVSLALVAIIWETSRTGSMDAAAAAAGVLTGFALVSRQGLALADANRMAARLREDEAHLRHMAFADALTGVANRRELLRVLHDREAEGPACSLLAIDLDGFKNINDLRGHDVGDAVLVEAAHRLRANLRTGDLPARMGGDEFAVLMWADEDAAHSAAERLLTTLCRPYQTDAGSVFVSASIGLAGHRSASDVAGLLRNADLALRFAKVRGKNRCERYDRTYEQWLRRRTDIEHELHGAVGRGELSLVYQPVVALPSGRPVGVEALVRWRHPRLGTVPPDEFIPVAEESGLIGVVDAWVLAQACRDLSRWLAAGYDLWLAVNISAREFHLVDYVAQVRGTLALHDVPPSRLVLEMTERTVAQDIDELVGQLVALREAGVRIAMDDFGAGYSSLGQLRTLPVDVLKIDRSLVGDPARPEASREVATLVDVVVRLGRRLHLQVIAEGVAEDAERALVVGAGCGYGQGDLFARPMAAVDVDVFLRGSAATVPGPRRAESRAPRSA